MTHRFEPPSTCIVSPVIQRASSDVSKAMTRPMSSGCAIRFGACMPSTASRPTSFLTTRADISVSTTPGATALVQIPRSLRANAKHRASEPGMPQPRPMQMTSERSGTPPYAYSKTLCPPVSRVRRRSCGSRLAMSALGRRLNAAGGPLRAQSGRAAPRMPLSCQRDGASPPGSRTPRGPPHPLAPVPRPLPPAAPHRPDRA